MDPPLSRVLTVTSVNAEPMHSHSPTHTTFGQTVHCAQDLT